MTALLPLEKAMQALHDDINGFVKMWQPIVETDFVVTMETSVQQLSHLSNFLTPV